MSTNDERPTRRGARPTRKAGDPPLDEAVKPLDDQAPVRRVAPAPRRRKTRTTIDQRSPVHAGAPSNVEAVLSAAMKIDGAIAAAITDFTSNRILGTAGGNEGFDVEAAARGNVMVLRAKRDVGRRLGLSGTIQDILITLDEQIHLLRPSRSFPHLFLYLAITQSHGNLALARFKLKTLEESLTP